jgi:YggT family protein
VMHELQASLRYLVFGAFALSVLVALASWLVRTRRVSPLGRLGRSLRAASDPVLRPVETRLLRLGGNPVNAGWWLVIGVAIAGVVLLSLFDWAVRTFQWMYAAFTGGPQGILVVLIVVGYNVLFVALMLRVIASWFGFFRYSRWMRPAYALTDWLVEPIRRLLPPTGAIDFSPLVALLVLWVLQKLLLSLVL